MGLENLYNILQSQQNAYDEAIDKLIHSDDEMKQSKITILQIKNAELARIIWLIEELMQE